MELTSKYQAYIQLLQLKFGNEYSHIIDHALAVAKLTQSFCAERKIHPIIEERAIKLALIHDLGKVQWLQDRKLSDFEATQLALKSVPSDFIPSDIDYIIYLLKYFNYEILNGASIMSFPIEVLVVAFTDLHVIETESVSIELRGEYLKQKYFENVNSENFINFWNLRIDFVNKFNAYFNDLEVPKDADSIISLALYTGGWLYKGEYELLIKASELAKNTNSHFVEVGSWRGKSTVLIANSLLGSNLNLCCIDNWQGGTDTDCLRLAKSFDMKTEFDNNTKLFGKNIRTIIGLSTEQNVIDLLPKQIGFIFFDGAHDYETVKQEIDIYLPMLVEGGVLCFHDTDNPRYPGVRKVIDEKISPFLSFIGQASYLSVYQK